MSKQKKFHVEKIRKRLKEILIDKSDDPRITVQIYERGSLMEIFRGVYHEGVDEGRRVERIILKNKIKQIL